jgi:hypothetical protein
VVTVRTDRSIKETPTMQQSATITTTRRGRLFTAVLSVALLAAACGSGSEAEGAPAVAALAEDEAAFSDRGAEGGDDGDSAAIDAAATDDDKPTPEEANVAFEQCLADNGVDNAFGGSGGESIDGEEDGPQTMRLDFDSEEEAEAFNEALDECNEIFEDAFGEFELSPEQEAEFADAEAAFNQCMAEQGFEMSDGGFEVEDIDDLDATTDQCDEIFEDLNDSIGEDE